MYLIAAELYVVADQKTADAAWNFYIQAAVLGSANAWDEKTMPVEYDELDYPRYQSYVEAFVATRMGLLIAARRELGLKPLRPSPAAVTAEA